MRLISWYRRKKLIKEPVAQKDATTAISAGKEVVVYDRYRFAVPLSGVVTRTSKFNDGVQVRLRESNNNHWPVGSLVWVHESQLRVKI